MSVLAVDGNSLVHRSFHAQADPTHPNWAVRGLLGQLVAAVDRIRPQVVVVGFDDPGRSLRRERWPDYKAHRTEKLPSLVSQLAIAVEALRELGTAVVVPDGLEADDVLASASAFAAAQNVPAVVVSSDRDAFALIDANTSVLRIINGGVDASPLMTAERLMLLLGVRPEQYRDYAALRGDSSDNLPGVRGIGPRLAARVLVEFGSAHAAFDDLAAVQDRLGTGVAARLACPGAREAWELSCQVMAMHDDVALGVALAGGPGVLPFDAAAVERVLRAHHLVWSVRDALEVLAHVDADERPGRPELAWTAEQRPAPPRMPVLPRRAESDQLALF
jgi:DNA polymerase-1